MFNNQEALIKAINLYSENFGSGTFVFNDIEIDIFSLYKTLNHHLELTPISSISLLPYMKGWDTLKSNRFYVRFNTTEFYLLDSSYSYKDIRDNILIPLVNILRKEFNISSTIPFTIIEKD